MIGALHSQLSTKMYQDLCKRAFKTSKSICERASSKVGGSGSIFSTRSTCTRPPRCSKNTRYNTSKHPDVPKNKLKQSKNTSKHPKSNSNPSKSICGRASSTFGGSRRVFSMVSKCTWPPCCRTCPPSDDRRPNNKNRVAASSVMTRKKKKTYTAGHLPFEFHDDIETAHSMKPQLRRL